MVLRTPEEDAINDRIIVRGLHKRADRVLALMLPAVTDKSLRFNDDIDELTNFPQSLLWRLKLDGVTGQRAQDELVSQLQFFVDKKARLLDKQFLIEQELTFRRDGKVARTEIID